MPTNLEEIRKLHNETKLISNNSLLNSSDDLLNYFIAVLKKEQPIIPPGLSINEWRNFINLLAPHGMLPFFYWRIYSLPKDMRPPDETTSYLKDVFLLSTARAMQIDNQVNALQKAFKNNNLPILILKGAALSRYAYPEPGLRPCTDIDLLIRPDDFLQADKVLNSLGYQSQVNYFEHFRDFAIEELYSAKDKYLVAIDLHWDTHSIFKIKKQENIEKLFMRAALGRISPVDALIQASIHMSMIHFCEMKLMWIMDIAMLIEQLKDHQDWLDLKSISLDWQARLAVGHSIKLAKLWFGAKTPEEYNDFMLNPKLCKEEIEIWDNTIKRYKSILNILNIRGISSIAMLWHYIFPPIKLMKMKYCYKYPWQLISCYIKRWVVYLRKWRGNRPDLSG